MNSDVNMITGYSQCCSTALATQQWSPYD